VNVGIIRKSDEILRQVEYDIAIAEWGFEYLLHLYLYFFGVDLPSHFQIGSLLIAVLTQIVDH
jgi:hypothetical protein